MNFSWAETYPEVHKDGPQCGLVALAMYMGDPSSTVQLLLESAKNAGYSNHGEMFSIENMASLAKSHLNLTSVQVYSGILNTDKMRENLLNGVSILVPYDTDKDNSPCLQNGHKAHWAVICGAVKTEDDFFVVARHGKVKNIAIWKLSDLSDSNAQLNEVGAYSKQPDLVFKLPEGGIDGPLGLKCKSVILKEL